ncbi:MAG: hypothetical protein HYZ14_18700 [Bacteroidetes bacterium]|nr:hypothetical protein [Bacteroidota bacterium]
MTKKAKIYSWKGLLINFIWRLAIPVFFIWLIPYMIDNDMINERKWANALVPLMIALIVGSITTFFYLVYYLIMVLTQLPDDNAATGKIKR